MNRSAGFTLIELIITVMLAAIVLVIGVPSFRTAILNSTRVAQTNELVGVLNLARSEAAKRGLRVVICRSSDGANCATDTTSIWENGWIVFVDQNQDGQLNFTLRSGGTFTQWVAYLPNGVSTGDTGLGTGTFRLCDDRGDSQARFIKISITGRVRSTIKENSGDICP